MIIDRTLTVLLFVAVKLSPLNIVFVLIVKGKISRGLDKAQIGLDIAGLTPGVGIAPDALNAIISAARGDKLGTITSLGAMIPVVGQGVTSGKYAVKLGNKYASMNLNKLIKSSKITNPYTKNKKLIKEGYTTMNLKQALASFKNSVDPKTIFRPLDRQGKIKPGIRIGRTTDGKTITIRSKSTSGKGPTIEIVGKNHTTKLRITGKNK